MGRGQCRTDRCARHRCHREPRHARDGVVGVGRRHEHAGGCRRRLLHHLPEPRHRGRCSHRHSAVPRTSRVCHAVRVRPRGESESRVAGSSRATRRCGDRPGRRVARCERGRTRVAAPDPDHGGNRTLARRPVRRCHTEHTRSRPPVRSVRRTPGILDGVRRFLSCGHRHPGRDQPVR